MIAVPEHWQSIANDALGAGVPQDQIGHFLRGAYIPQPKQLQFHAAARLCDYPDMPVEVGLGGARGGGKSHGSFAQLVLDDCQRMPGLKALYLRRAAAQAREQFEDLRRSVLGAVPHEYRAHLGILEFPNGSRVIVGSFRNEGDVDKYLGLEYDAILIEEATTLTRGKMQSLRDSVRTSKPDWRPRIYSTTNPGGVGHRWYMNEFVLPYRRHEVGRTIFVPATVDDNIHVNREYVKNLEMNTGWRLRAYRYGDWDIASGQFFTTFRHDVHVRKGLKPLHGWPVWAAIDYGFIHPTSVHFLTRAADGICYVFAEHHAARLLPTMHASAMKGVLGRHGRSIREVYPWIGGLDMFATVPGQEYTLAEQYRGLLRVGLRRADADRINGAARLLELLGDPDNGLTPRVYFDSSCTALIEQIPAMIHDPGRPEDVLKQDANEDGSEGDDAYDSVRYALMSRQWLGRSSSYIGKKDSRR